ncbi:MAG: hypothetical protein PHX25_02795 [Candidatus Pacebacteria bacterium]|nr:hypothetical protein [Candidatus Paceibacterota bacterium]
MEKKNYYWILSIALVLLIGGFLYYQKYVVVNNQSNDDESSEINNDNILLQEDNTSTSTTKIYGEGYEEFLVGSWQNTEDALDKLIINQDGSLNYIYGENVVGSGKWSTEGFHLKVMLNVNDKVYNVWFTGAERLEISEVGSDKRLNFVRMIK